MLLSTPNLVISPVVNSQPSFLGFRSDHRVSSIYNSSDLFRRKGFFQKEISPVQALDFVHESFSNSIRGILKVGNVKP